MADLTDPKVVKELERRARIQEREDGAVVVNQMNTMQGRSYMYRRLGECHVFHSSFSPDAYQTAFNEGERNVGLRLLAEITRWCPQQYTLMLREANERYTSNELAGSQNGNGRVEGSDLDGADFDTGPDETRPVEDDRAIDYQALDREIRKNLSDERGGQVKD